MDKWTILDPNNKDNDISGGSTNAPVIKKKFSEAYASLVNRMERMHHTRIELRKGQSLLGEVFGGNYSSFVYQRNHMNAIHAQSYY
jgi:non-canonical poly(A) RNA polymerase PAPD5/7